MNVCHFLLGRPWKYDRKSINYGRWNIYTLDKDGQKHTLLPLKDEVEEEINPKVFLISGKELL